MVLLSTPGGRVEIGLPCTTSQAGGPLKKRRESGDWVALITSHRGSTYTSVATTEVLRKYKAVAMEVQGST